MMAPNSVANCQSSPAISRAASARDHPGHQHPAGDEAPHHPFQSADLLETQGQAAFEQDHRHREGHEGEEQRTHEGVRIQPTRRRADQDADEQQEQDRRQPHPPGEPLAGGAEQGDGRGRNDCVLIHPGLRTGPIRLGIIRLRAGEMTATRRQLEPYCPRRQIRAAEPTPICLGIRRLQCISLFSPPMAVLIDVGFG